MSTDDTGYGKLEIDGYYNPVTGDGSPSLNENIEFDLDLIVDVLKDINLPETKKKPINYENVYIKRIGFEASKCKGSKNSPCTKHKIFCVACGKCLLTLYWIKYLPTTTTIMTTKNRCHYICDNPMCKKCFERARRFDEKIDPTEE